jgi:ribosomal protein L40E
MEPLDGNAIAGELFEIFGRDMTCARGICTQCRATAQVGELVVYARAPGTVVRCRRCGSVALVLVNIRGATRLHNARFKLDNDERC